MRAKHWLANIGEKAFRLWLKQQIQIIIVELAEEAAKRQDDVDREALRAIEDV